MRSFDKEIAATQQWFDSPRFAGIVRLYTARQVVEQRGTIASDYTVAREAAAAFHDRLRQLFTERKCITTFGPYSPGQAVTMKRMGIEGIYLGGWATSAKGGTSEDPGPDLASYPLSQVPDEAATLVRALLTADRNQQYLRSRMTEAQRAATLAHDFRPFIIADADTGHGGDPHVRNLIRRFVEAGVAGYHIEDQRPGTKKCGHQGGKVLVAQDEQNKRLNAARFQLDVMGVPGLIVARTDAEAANLIDGRGDERDQPFLVGATNPDVPAYKPCFLALIQHFHELGVAGLNGHLLYAIPAGEHAVAQEWLERRGILSQAAEAVASLREGKETSIDAMFDRIAARFLEAWEDEARLRTFGEAVAEVLEFRESEGEPLQTSVDEWQRFAARASLYAAREKARELGADVEWDCEAAKTPEGYYQVRGGIPYAIAKSLAAAPFADLLWMETKTADLADAHQFAEAIHSEFPQDARLQPLAVVQLGHHRHGRRGNATLPRGARQAGLRLQLHHLRRSPDRRPRRRGVGHRPQTGRHARSCPPATKIPHGRVSLPHAPDPRRRTARGRRIGRYVGAHGDDHGDGQGLDPAPAPDTDRGA